MGRAADRPQTPDASTNRAASRPFRFIAFALFALREAIVRAKSTSGESAAADQTSRDKPADRETGDKQEVVGLKSLAKERSVRFLVGRYSLDGKSVAALISRYRVRPGERFDGRSYRESVELVTIDASTGELRDVVRYPGEGLHAPLCWSPDGGEILFSRSLKPDDRREDLGPGEPGLGIWAIRPDGSKARFLTTGWCADWR